MKIMWFILALIPISTIVEGEDSNQYEDSLNHIIFDLNEELNVDSNHSFFEVDERDLSLMQWFSNELTPQELSKSYENTMKEDIEDNRTSLRDYTPTSEKVPSRKNLFQSKKVDPIKKGS